MSHITIIIQRNASPSGAAEATPAEGQTGITYASVQYTPPDSMSDQEVAHEVKKLYKQVKDLGT